MLEKLDKISLYLAMVIMGYLGYKMTVQGAESIVPEEKMPVITKRMLEPEFLEPRDSSSPASRDPFYVEWASYFDFSELTGNFSETQEMSPNQSVPVFTKRLMAVLTAWDGQNAALIDGKVYETGSLIDGNEPEKCWRIETIRKNEVVIEFNQNKQVLKVTDIQDLNKNQDVEKQESDN